MQPVPLQFERIPLIHAWLPDETLFSLASRFHRIAGNTRPAATGLQLFGHFRQGAAHDFPCRLDQLCQRFEGRLGTASDLAVEKTLLRYYWRFIDQSLREAAVQAMCGPAIGGLKFALGLITSRFRANHPLKACLRCIHEDQSRFHCAYWHLEHQFPGLWVCRQHGEVLRSCMLKSTGVQRFGWVLPGDASFHPLPSPVPLRALEQMANVVRRLVACPGSFDRGQAAQAYGTELLSRGYRRRSGRLDVDAAAVDLAEFAAPLTVMEELKALPSTPASAKHTLYRALSTQRNLTHPIWHAMLITWLFGANGQWPWEVSAPVVPQTMPAVQAKSRGIHCLDEGVRLTLSTAPSARVAATKLGIDVTTAMAWAASIGVAFKRRPKLLGGDVEARLLADLRVGADKQRAASAAGVTVQTITRYLRTVPGLHEQWIRARFELAQQSARARWLSLLQLRELGTGVSRIRALDPAAYAWLYRNDAAWLAAQSQAHQVKAEMQRPRQRVNWDDRDRLLAQEVERVGLQIFQDSGAVRVWQVYQHLPALKAKLAMLDRLPLTRAALSRLTRRGGKGLEEPSLLQGGKIL